MADTVTGILEIESKGYGFLRQLSPTLAKSKTDTYVPQGLIRGANLRDGNWIEGNASETAAKKIELSSILAVNDIDPSVWKTLKEFSQHDVISPNVQLRLEPDRTATRKTLGDTSMRVVDLFSPLGKGQRALIVSPPKAGKTMLMQQIAHAISTNHPDIELVVLLVDERPEEVTDMRRTIKGRVFASSSDSDRGAHVRLAKLVLEYARRTVEAGRDVVLLLDSLTRLGRAFNVHQKSSGRTMSGGVDVRALEIPKRIFGAARNCEGGGSLTIVATALIDTGSRMDELIFQEFKGTGNMELVLDRDMANERIFPAINIHKSGTRREELLFGNATQLYQTLRRSLVRVSPRDAMLAVQKLLAQYPTNEMLISKFE